MKIALYIVACLVCFTGSVCKGADPADSESPQIQSARSAYLNDLIRPHRYSAGKNSFILQRLARNEKKTLLQLDGSGSVRHIWTTWPVETHEGMAGQVLLCVYLNGEAQPAIEGSISRQAGSLLKCVTDFSISPIIFAISP